MAAQERSALVTYVDAPHVEVVGVVAGEDDARVVAFDDEVQVEVVGQMGLSGSGVPSIRTINEQASVADSAAREGIRGIREIFVDERVRILSAKVGHNDVVKVSPFGAVFPDADVPIAIVSAIGIRARVHQHLIYISGGGVAVHFDAQVVRLVQLQVDERTQVDFLQASGELLVSTIDVRTQAGIARFEVNLP